MYILKRFFIYSFLSFLTNVTIAQCLTFGEVEKIRDFDLADFELFLTNRDWQLTDVNEKNDNQLAKAVFAYGLLDDDKESAECWVTFWPKTDSVCEGRILIQISNKKFFGEFIRELKSKNYILKKSRIINGELKKLYQNKSITCEVTTSLERNPENIKSIYSFFICDNSEVKLIFGNKYFP